MKLKTQNQERLMCMYSEAQGFSNHWELLHVIRCIRAASHAASGTQELVQ